MSALEGRGRSGCGEGRGGAAASCGTADKAWSDVKSIVSIGVLAHPLD